MKFTKYNNPNKRRKHRASKYSQAYIDERRNEMHQLLAQAETDDEKKAIITAFNISIMK